MRIDCIRIFDQKTHRFGDPVAPRATLGCLSLSHLPRPQSGLPLGPPTPPTISRSTQNMQKRLFGGYSYEPCIELARERNISPAFPLRLTKASAALKYPAPLPTAFYQPSTAPDRIRTTPPHRKLSGSKIMVIIPPETMNQATTVIDDTKSSISQ